MFPQDGIGVPQGSSLSAFSGNVLLYEFDRMLNTDETRSYRYIDDVIILGRDKTSVDKARSEAIKWLKAKGMSLYPPTKGSDKAEEGKVENSFTYLGCKIMPNQVAPCKPSMQNLLKKIDSEITGSKKFITQLLDNNSPRKLEATYIQSLSRIDRIIYGWGKRFVLKVATLAQDEEAKSRADVVDYTADRMKRGEPTVGIPTLADLIGEQAAKDIAKYLPFDSDAGDMIEEFNNNFAFVVVPPNSQIIRERKNKKGYIEFDLLNITTFKQLTASIWHQKAKAADIWLASPMRRTYDGLEFAPQNPTNGKYNLFKGFPVKPLRGDCSLYLDHIKNIICGSNDEYYKYFISWMADIIQSAENKPGTAIVIRGNQGTGKSIVFKHFGVLLGGHYKIADNARYISGSFNSHLHDCLLLHLEEAFFAGDKKLEASLKEMITGDTVLMEYKGREPLIAKNFARLAITTNSNWAVPAGMEERRFFILEASNEKQQNKAYFGKIANQMQNGGYDALMDYLFNYQYDPKALRTVPKTTALLEQKMHSLSREQDWWFNILKDGSLPCQDGWTGICGTDHLHDNLYQYAKLLGGHYRPSKTALGIFIKRMVPNVTKHRGSYKCLETFHDTTEESKERGHYYSFPSLDECRGYFEEQMGQKIEWD